MSNQCNNIKPKKKKNIYLIIYLFIYLYLKKIIPGFLFR